MTTRAWDQDHADRIANQTLERLDSLEVVRRKGIKLIVRLPVEDGKTAIVKFWKAAGVRGRLRKALRISDADHEWKNLSVAADIGLRAPRPYGLVHFREERLGFHSALISEDMGACKPCLPLIKNHAAAGEEEELRQLEESVIDLTCVMISGRLLDFDHGLMNVAVSGSGEVIRLDLEMARPVRSVSRHPRLLGRMLSRLITTYTFAVQPDQDRVSRFVEQLNQAIQPSNKAKALASEYFRRTMLRQEKASPQWVSPALRW